MNNFKKVPKSIFDKVEVNKEMFVLEFRDKLAQMFPETVKDGKIDVESLLEEFAKYTEDREKEKYSLTWD